MYSKMIRILLFISLCYDVYSFNPSFGSINRREFVYLSGGGLATGLGLKQRKSICVIGANGETGRECIKIISDMKQPVKALSRKAIKYNEMNITNMNYINNIQIDIRDHDKVDNALSDVSSVIFLANAKKTYRYIKTDTETFQNYEDIDVLALSNVVDSCVKYKIPRLIYVSSTCTSCLENGRQDIDKISGIECENCLAKQMGESLIKQRFTEARKQGTEIDYTIVRIGYLINGENRGAKDIELNQDYTKSGMISRTDLANICVNALHDPNTYQTTFEAYYRDTTQPYDVKDSLTRCTNLGRSVEECFFGSEYKNKKPENLEEVRKKPIKGSLFTTGNEFQGESWKELFKDLRKDKKPNKVFDNNEDVIDLPIGTS